MFVPACILILALSRAELIARFRAPIITQADGMIKVYADCPEDLRSEYQVPVARFATETVRALDRLTRRPAGKFDYPRLLIHLGEVRTNCAWVLARAITNGQRVVTRITLPSPAHADLDRFRTEVIRAYYRGVHGVEVDDSAATAAYRKSDPTVRIRDERTELENYLRAGQGDYERGTELLRKIIEPGRATRRDVLTFASRLYLYPPCHALRFANRYDRLSFREALVQANADPRVRLAAYAKASELPAFGGGRGRTLQLAAYAYMDYLLALSEDADDRERLKDLLEKAECLLNQAYEECTE